MADVDDRIIGRRILRFDKVTSTNDIARDLASKGADEGTTIVAAEQILGRGSRGRKWISPSDENLLFSVILRPPVELERLGELAFVAALAIARCLIDRLALQATIKWPNDVRVGGKKIAGILIEAAPGKGASCAIVGIGLNVNWTNLPADLAHSATSVLIESRREIDPEAALEGLLEALDWAYRLYRDEGFTPVLAEWSALECTTGSKVSVYLDGETVRGVAEKIDTNGSLVVRLEDGSLRNFSASSLIVE